MIGPQAVNPSDVLARMMEEAKGTLVTSHRSATPENERRAYVLQRGRMAATLSDEERQKRGFLTRAQLRRKYANHGRTEFLLAVSR